MSGIDWVVLGIYIAIVIGIGIRANRNQIDSESYFLGNRGLPWWAVGFSIIATSFSATSILGLPGIAYAGDLWYLQFQLGDLLAAIVVCLLFIPFFHRIRLVSAYEYLEARFDLKTRLLGSALFIVQALLRSGTLLYGAALLFSKIAPLGGILPGEFSAVEEAIIIFGVIAIIYTALGGISAVIWTDVIQFAIIAIGIAALVAISVHDTPGGWATAWNTASEAGKLQVIHFDLSQPEWKKGILCAVFGYGLLAMSLFGTGQQAVQRYMAVKNQRDGQRALLLGVVSGAVAVTFCLLLGTFLSVYYAYHTGKLPEGVSPDDIVPIFIRDEAPPIMTGLLVSAVFAAAMSSLDSALNSLSTAFVVDFYSRLSRTPPGEKKKLKIAKCVVVIAGIIAIFIGVRASREKLLLIDQILKLMGYAGGGVLGLFILGMLCKRATGTGAFIGALVSTLFIMTMSVNPPFGLPELYKYVGMEPVPFLWFTAIALPMTIVIGYALSLLGPGPPPEKIRGLVRGVD